ncbi:MAG: NAD-dependent epimerase/dehydratase family protein [Acidobacteria bacterium]|nr:NAD-dependent epimerase/dehydratase family protein [Acidobacteriota bacterium]
MRVAVIGGTGHIGSYLVPALVELGAAVTSVSRGIRNPYVRHPLWEQVQQVRFDRAVEEERGAFGERMAQLNADVVVDLTCYREESARQLIVALAGRIGHFLHCGTIWVHGPSSEVPTSEQQPRRPFGDYGCRKAAIEAFLLEQASERRFPATVLHPGHLVGPGWAPINPAGNFNLQVFSDLASGNEILLPDRGLETVHHVHAADVAQAFVKAIKNRDVALGQSFHVVSPAALTLRGYAERMGEWWGQPARLRFLPWEEWRKNFSEKDCTVTWDHIAHSPNCSIHKARTLLGYEPRYSSLAAVRESLAWLVEHQKVPDRGTRWSNIAPPIRET